MLRQMNERVRRWIIGLGLGTLAMGIGACGGDDDDSDATPSGGSSSAGSAGESGAAAAGGSAGGDAAGASSGGSAGGGAAGDAGSAGDGPSVLSFSRVGSGDGFVGEDPAMLVVDGAPAVGYTVFDVGPRLHFYADGDWGESVSDPTSGPGVLNAYRQTGFCSDGTSVFLAHTQVGEAGGYLHNRLFVYRYRNETWSPFGGGQISLGADEGLSAWEPGIVCPSGAEPAVTWVQIPTPPGSDVTETAGWVALLASGSATRSGPLEAITHDEAVTDVRVTSVAYADGGPVYVAAWEDDGELGQQLFVYAFDGSNVAQLGDSIATDQTPPTPHNPFEPAIAIDDGAPVVAWAAALGDDGNRDIFAARWDGSDWEPVGDGPIRGFPDTHFMSREPALIVADGKLVLAWAESSESEPMSIFLAEWTGSAWSLLSDVLNIDPTRDTEDPSIACANGVYYVAFEEFVEGGKQIFVKTSG
jgi:hypothetical protein